MASESKKIVVGFFLYLQVFNRSISAFAQRDVKVFPSKIKCHAKLIGTSSDFTIVKLNTVEPEASLDDQSFLQFDLGVSTLELNFSNQCDNMYTIVFLQDDLMNLKNKKVKLVKALMNYGNSEMSENGGNEVVPLTVSVTCTL